MIKKIITIMILMFSVASMNAVIPNGSYPIEVSTEMYKQDWNECQGTKNISLYTCLYTVICGMS